MTRLFLISLDSIHHMMDKFEAGEDSENAADEIGKSVPMRLQPAWRDKKFNNP